MGSGNSKRESGMSRDSAQFLTREQKDAGECTYAYVRNVLTLSEAKYRYSDEKIQEIQREYASYESAMDSYYERTHMVPILILPDREALNLRVQRLHIIKKSSHFIESYLRFSAALVHATVVHGAEELDKLEGSGLFGFGVGPKAYGFSYVGRFPEGDRGAFKLRYYFLPRESDLEDFRASLIKMVESDESKKSGLIDLFCPNWLKESMINFSAE